MPQVTHPDKFPYHCVGLLQVTLHGGGGGWGTGTLIDQKYIITCGHNIVYGGKQASAAVFHPAYSSATQPTAGLQVDCGFVKRLFMKGDRSWDIGVYRLSNPHYLSKFMQPEIVEHNREPTKEMLVTGYPGDHHYHMWEDQEVVTGFNVAQHLFAYTHRTAPGSSGSPLYQHTGGKAFLYGVHSGLAQNLEDKVGVLITQETYGFVHAALQWGQAETFTIIID
jgi:V8-like Glu-specific endopeptidase